MSDMKILLVIFALIFGGVIANLSYSLYTNAENRKLYAECLRLTEKLLDADPKRISVPFCRL